MRNLPLRTIRVLVVEDDNSWREALYRMYIKVLKQANVQPVVQLASSGREALQMLRPAAFDLLSLDINLGLTQPTNARGLPDLSIPGANGLDVLEEAYKQQACSGVVVVTGIQHDTTFDVVVPDRSERQRIKTTLPVHLNKLFPDKNRVLYKDPGASMNEALRIYRDILTPQNILHLCETPEPILWIHIRKTMFEAIWAAMIPSPDFWGESEKVDEKITEMIEKIIIAHGRNEQGAEDAAKRLYEILKSQRNPRFQRIISMSKATGLVLGGIMGASINQGMGAAIGALAGVLIGSVIAAVLYAYQVVEIGIKTMSRFSRS